MKYILIVEDDQFLRDAYSAKFGRSKDIEFDIAQDGEEALQKISTRMPDAMIVDLIMPNANGFELLRILQQKGLTIPVLVASNLDGAKDIEQAMQLGARDYFIKSDTSINDVIDKVLSLTA